MIERKLPCASTALLAGHKLFDSILDDSLRLLSMFSFRILLIDNKTSQPASKSPTRICSYAIASNNSLSSLPGRNHHLPGIRRRAYDYTKMVLDLLMRDNPKDGEKDKENKKEKNNSKKNKK